MLARNLVHAWLALLVLSFGTVLLAASADVLDPGGTLIAAGVFILAGMKAYVILTRYLGLSDSRFWTTVFAGVVGLFLVLSYGLYVFGSVG